MKKIAAILLAMPMLAHGASDIVPDPASAKACYATLTDASSKDEVLKAVSCLRDNPYVGEPTVKEFTDARSAVLTKYQQAAEGPELGAALEQLRARKARRLYVAFQSRWQGRSLLVVDRAVMRIYHSPTNPELITVRDLDAMKLRFAEKSGIFSADTTVPLPEVRAFEYEESPRGQRIGRLVTTHTDGTKAEHTSYQGEYPVRACDTTCKRWHAILSFGGTLYQGANKVDNSSLELEQVGLSTYSIAFLSEDEGKAEIARVQAAMKDKELAATQARQAAEKASAAAAQKIALNLAQMAKAKIGSEDSCQRTDLARYVVVKDPSTQDVEVNCQFGGVVTLHGLKGAGWLIVNKQWREDVVTEYLIRKAR